MFADADFILALIKESDWLKTNAEKILEDNKDKIGTSISVMIELAHVCRRHKLNVLEIFTHVFEIIDVNGETYSVCMKAGFYMEKYDLSVFDAFHAAFCGNDAIISSDSVFDDVGLKRIKLEK